jgi:hypothetical protein
MRHPYDNENRARLYDKFLDLSQYIEELRKLKKHKREKILINLKDLIISHDDTLFDKHVQEFPITVKKRWYDKDPFSWIVVNALKYADTDLLIKLFDYFEKSLK